MSFSENSLMGNIKHNTSNVFHKTKHWASAKYKALLIHVEDLADDHNPRALQELKKMADEYSIPHDIETTKEELVERVKECFNQKQFNP
jgi:hypothetical protein